MTSDKKKEKKFHLQAYYVVSDYFQT